MNNRRTHPSPAGQNDFEHRVRRKAERRMKAQTERDRGIWFGLGMFGLVGWTVAIPTVIGLAVGIWIDRRWPSSYSWTLMGLIIGVMFGCIAAWRWIKKESGEGLR